MEILEMDIISKRSVTYINFLLELYLPLYENSILFLSNFLFVFLSVNQNKKNWFSDIVAVDFPWLIDLIDILIIYLIDYLITGSRNPSIYAGFSDERWKTSPRKVE